MNHKFIDIISEATLEVLSTMAGIEPNRDEPSIKRDAKACGDVSGVMSLVGSEAKGSIAITMTKPVVFELIHLMLGMEIDELNDLARDTAGEIANMITGVTQRLVQERLGYSMSISLPTVISGECHLVSHKFDGDKIILPFETGTGKFFVEFCFEESAR